MFSLPFTNCVSLSDNRLFLLVYSCFFHLCGLSSFFLSSYSFIFLLWVFSYVFVLSESWTRYYCWCFSFHFLLVRRRWVFETLKVCLNGLRFQFPVVKYCSLPWSLFSDILLLLEFMEIWVTRISCKNKWFDDIEFIFNFFML